MDEKQFEELSAKLDAMLKLLALGLPESLTSQEKIARLKGTGMTAAQVAEVLGVSSGYVSVAIARSKTKKPKAKP